MKNKKIISAGLAIILAMMSILQAYAYVPSGDELISPQYNYSNWFDAEISKSGSTLTATCEYENNKSCDVKITLSIQRKTTTGGTWSNVKSEVFTLFAPVSDLLSISNTFVSGYSYRAKAVLEVKKNNVIVEQDTIYSNII